ncbi:nuclear transport factor 2 family protein [Fodinibius sp.]|uniref:nuclear transport factor 2 family protein n=1 Tax=Fodinibius sp. TaxID=1872440 RepID=UPI002ACD5DE9|nr:nuclear transport factor 2 family protein [Fodinibius sp.]MDZ7659616.1 nuclear transport factor 2 family protein [Fodinibius sp.]
MINKTLVYILIIPALFILMVSCSSGNEQSRQVQKKAINTILDDWHLAATEANFERYFMHFTGDSAIFMGTDATERWTVAEFKPWAKPYFDDGEAWDFTPVERHVYLSDNRQTAWFDESLDTPNLGPARGSGVLVKQEKTWKIAHYNLSIPIPNALVDTVVKQVEKVLEDSVSEEVDD